MSNGGAQIAPDMKDPNMELFQHQIHGIEFLKNAHGSALLADEPGLGKTRQSLAYLFETESYPAVIVCPASVKGVWQKEIELLNGPEPHVLFGEMPAEHDPDEVKIVVVNYDILAAQMPFIGKINPKQIIFDECHCLANPRAKWTRAAMYLSRRSPRVIGLSGTPITNRPSDFWSILHIIKPEEFPSFSEFAWRYCDPKRGFQGRWDYTGSSNLDELHKRIQPFTLRRKKKDVLTLPKQSIQMETVEMDRPEEYEEANSNFIKWAQRTGKAVDKIRKAEAITKTTALLSLVARLKSRQTVLWLQNELEKDSALKLIVFCTHTGMLDVIYRRVCPEQALMIDGSVSSAKRKGIIQKFQEDPHYRMIVCNIKAAGAGITLTAAAKTVFVELPWKPADILQAKDRNHRIGQDKDTEVVFLVAKDSIEERLCRILQEKANVSDQIIDGKPVKEIPILDLLLAETTKSKSKL